VRGTDPRILFGLRLAQLRKKRGWSQETLALESGVARSYLGGRRTWQTKSVVDKHLSTAETLELPPPALLEFDGVRPLAKKLRRTFEILCSVIAVFAEERVAVALAK